MFDFLIDNPTDFSEAVQQLETTQVGSKVTFYNQVDDIKDFDFVVICVDESRGNPDNNTSIDFEHIKYAFYELQLGNWEISILDLGVIKPGNEISDTFYALRQVVNFALEHHTLPIILGGSQDILYSQYRAYDGVKYMINIANIDFKFDLGDSNATLNHESYLSHMVVNKPYNLFNYANIGYQTFYNTQEEIHLLDKMFFEAYRLGDIVNDIKIVEPVLRDADIAALDVRCIESQSVLQDEMQPNGFNNREICGLSRYAGLSDKVSSFGIYELQYLHSQTSKKLLGQILWYFVEGTQYRLKEIADVNNPNFIKYQVPVDNETLIFYESQVSRRWWIEIPSNLNNVNNKLKQHTLLPCDKENYLSACNQELPERWLKAKQKNEF
ncbi:formimidoylglutamase [Mesohalobacter halotolerans]|uniref:formimidoylglutamase n=1 Tax=Mesohalobacter halotolerans TaxID=1883405 RepID=UPI001485D4A6|nr:formimidoylglutamase [Mesohalobacter halotolerans]MBS3737982.1 formimidoylglutamase [Psychroflexus sp.]